MTTEVTTAEQWDSIDFINSKNSREHSKKDGGREVLR